MKKEDLMKIEGITEEVAAAVEKLSAEELKGFIPKARFDEVNESKKNAEALVKERDKQLEDLKKTSGATDELKQQIESLQEANKAAKVDYESQIRTMQINNAVTTALMGSGAKNVKATMALLNDLDKAELTEDGSIKGLSDQIKALQKSDSYLFETKGGSPAGPSGVTPVGNPQGGAPKGITKEQFNRMGYKEKVELFNTDRAAYDALTGHNGE